MRDTLDTARGEEGSPRIRYLELIDQDGNGEKLIIFTRSLHGSEKLSDVKQRLWAAKVDK